MKKNAIAERLATALMPVEVDTKHSRVLVWSDSFIGDLRDMAGAQTTRNQLESVAGVDGNWIAWLSTDSIDVVVRFRPGSASSARARLSHA